MKVVVCIKQVPDTNEVRLDPVKGTLIREGVPSIINPDDKAGLEAALVLKDLYDAHVTVLTMGPGQAKVALQEAYAMGADRVILLTDRVFAGSDTLATSTALAGALRFENKGDHAIVKRAFEDGHQMIKVKYPCLITTLSELNKPRYMSVAGIINAHRELEVEEWNFQSITADETKLGLKGSPTKVKKSFTKSTKGAGVKLEGTAEEMATAIIDKLQATFII